MTETKKRDPILSPSGKYTLQITSEPTKPGCWDYTVGTVSLTESGKVLDTVKRNYHSFGHCWIEGHANGHDYLVCGEDYQGQTVLELDTGRRRNFLPEEAKKGAGFCWVAYSYHAGQQLLVVDGCYWACPYEVRLYDFSDPMEKGWAQIEFPEGRYGESSNKDPEIYDDGKVKFFETAWINEDEEGEDSSQHEVVAWTLYQREGLKLRFLEFWIAEKEQKKRDEREAANKRYEEAWEAYKANDPYYLTFKERVANMGIPIEWGMISTGVCHENWSPIYKGSNSYKEGERADSRVCFHLSRVVNGVKLTIDIEWGRTEAPILFRVYRDSAKAEDVWYERSIENLGKAFDAAGALLSA